MRINDKITLTQNEQELFKFLLEVVKHKELNVILRVAGGWVRDKLLIRESNDIDIALPIPEDAPVTIATFGIMIS